MFVFYKIYVTAHLNLRSHIAEIVNDLYIFQFAWVLNILNLLLLYFRHFAEIFVPFHYLNFCKQAGRGAV